MYIEDQTFKGIDVETLRKAEYEYCTFINCDFGNYNLSGFKFIECDFDGCNFSNANLVDTAFKQVTFTECKMLGLLFDKCDLFNLEMKFENTMLSHSSFYKLNLKRTVFNTCNLTAVDFSEANLSDAYFDGSDLSGAIFQNSNLQGADFRGAENFTIHPEENTIKGSKFLKSNLEGLLRHYKIKLS